MEEKIKEVFLKVIGEYELEKKQSDYESWDSFSHMALVSEIENQFHISLNSEEVVSIESAKDILNIINKKNGSNNSFSS